MADARARASARPWRPRSPFPSSGRRPPMPRASRGASSWSSKRPRPPGARPPSTPCSTARASRGRGAESPGSESRPCAARRPRSRGSAVIRRSGACPPNGSATCAGCRTTSPSPRPRRLSAACRAGLRFSGASPARTFRPRGTSRRAAARSWGCSTRASTATTPSSGRSCTRPTRSALSPAPRSTRTVMARTSAVWRAPGPTTRWAPPVPAGTAAWPLSRSRACSTRTSSPGSIRRFDAAPTRST